MYFQWFFADGDGAVLGRIVFDGSYVSPSSEVNIMAHVVEAVDLAAVVLKQITYGVGGIVFRRFLLQRDGRVA